jgi:16S rRNA (adenine1518-N6/adenine1519-N6)-dimethyltransferase
MANFRIKKEFGQHFLRDGLVVEHMLDGVQLTPESSVFEIGCGDGFLTHKILERNCKRLWVFEIDPEWGNYVQENIPDDRLTIFIENFLDIDFARLQEHKPWTLLANLPYQITFPIMHKLLKHRDMLTEGVVMMQEEVAQKIVKKGGRGYGFPSLYFQHYFELKLLDKIPPEAFLPPPKVFSRLLYFKPKAKPVVIPNEPEFWKFIKTCFRQPRRTFRNNLQQTQVDLSFFTEDQLKLRAQQMSMQDFLTFWEKINK